MAQRSVHTLVPAEITLLKQTYQYHKLRKSFYKLYRWYLNSMWDLNLSCARDFQNQSFMATLCINERNSTHNFSAQFIKIIYHYKKIGYNTITHCNRLHVWRSTQSTLLSSLIARWRDGPQTLWRSGLKNLSIGERLGPDVVSAVGPTGYHLLRYSVECTVVSWFLFYLLFISRFEYTRRWYIDK